MKKILLLFALGISSLGFSQACFDGGTGVDGAYTATANTTIAGGVYNFTSFDINAGVTVTVTGTSPLEIYCQGAMTISGILSASGENGSDGVTFASAGIGGVAVAGGGDGGGGSYSSSTGPLDGIDGMNSGGSFTFGSGWSGGGGASYGSAGTSTGGVGGAAGGVYGTSDLIILTSGSGGGGGSGGNSCGAGGGGAGGGIIVIHASTINLTFGGVIASNGGNGGSDGTGNCGGGGGGSGGTIWIETPALNNDGVIQTSGGIGGASAIAGTPYFGTGGDGGEGRIRIDGNILGNGLISAGSLYTDQLSVAQSSQTLSVCYGETATVGQNIYSTTGIYTDTLLTTTGCDSIVTTDLTVAPQIDVTLTLIGNVLAANAPSVSYQWIDCANFTVIQNETNQVFSPSVVGSYAVIVYNGNCSDTSICQVIDFAGIDETGTKFVSIHPNPTNGVIALQGVEKFAGFESLEIFTASGQKVANFTELKKSYDLSTLENGVYFLTIQSTIGTETVRFIKN